MTENEIQKGKTLAFVSYITVIGTLIAFFMNQENKNPFTSFHVRQALGLWLLEMALARNQSATVDTHSSTTNGGFQAA